MAERGMRSRTRKAAVALLLPVPVTVLLLAALNPTRASAVPSYARQTGLACSGCHYAPPELNPAGRTFKVLGYVDRGAETKVVQAEGGGKTHSPLELLASLPLSVMLEASYTQVKSRLPATQNGSFEVPQDVALFLAGAWTSHVGSFLQVTYDTQKDHLSMDNTDIRYANKTKMGGKELVWGLDLNNNPTLDDLWNDTPAWGFPWVASDFAPKPGATPLINGSLAQDVAGAGAYALWNDHLYLDATLYRSQHVGAPQPNPGTGFGINIRGVAPYWRIAWQGSTDETQFEVGSYGMHVKTSPNDISGPEDVYTDWALDAQVDQSFFRTDVLSLRGTYIRESSNLAASAAAGTALPGGHHLRTVMANAEYHFGTRYTATLAWFDTQGTVDPTLYSPSPLTGSANGNPGSSGYIVNVSYWPWQNLQVAAQYTAFTRFNGGTTNYDGSGRSASANNTLYLDLKFLF